MNETYNELVERLIRQNLHYSTRAGRYRAERNTHQRQSEQRNLLLQQQLIQNNQLRNQVQQLQQQLNLLGNNPGMAAALQTFISNELITANQESIERLRKFNSPKL